MTSPSFTLAFIGGGNMASAILGGLRRQGFRPDQLLVVEPHEETRERLLSSYGIKALPCASSDLTSASLVVWAIKPQVFHEVALQTRPFCGPALHVSVAAGIRSDSIAQWLGSEQVVRAMPNTPALIGQGQTGLYARPAVDEPAKQRVNQIMASTGALLWVEEEPLLDAVTALSGSGPAYVFYFMEAMVAAGVQMGLRPEQAHQLAVGTFVGASALAHASTESPGVLRERVTSKGGTTHAALTVMQAAHLDTLFANALEAARQRAQALGASFGAP